MGKRTKKPTNQVAVPDTQTADTAVSDTPTSDSVVPGAETSGTVVPATETSGAVVPETETSGAVVPEAVAPETETSDAAADTAIEETKKENKASIIKNLINMPSKAFASLTGKTDFAQKHRIAINFVGWSTLIGGLIGVVGFTTAALLGSPVVIPMVAYFSIFHDLSFTALSMAVGVTGGVTAGAAAGVFATVLSTGFTFGKAAISGLKNLFSSTEVSGSVEVEGQTPSNLPSEGTHTTSPGCFTLPTQVSSALALLNSQMDPTASIHSEPHDEHALDDEIIPLPGHEDKSEHVTSQADNINLLGLLSSRGESPTGTLSQPQGIPFPAASITL